MLNFKPTIRRGPAVLLLLVLTALVAVSVTGFAKDLRRQKPGGRSVAARGHLDTAPMTMIQGVLSRGSDGAWNLDGRSVRFEQECSFLNQTNPDGGGGPASGEEAVLMGYQRPDHFLAYSGLILRSASDEPPPNDSARALVRTSVTDAAVGEADPSIPK
jgi:hypothetical protein